MSKIINIDVGIECKIKNVEIDGTQQSNICLSTGNQKNIKVKFNFIDDDWKKSGLIKRATFQQINIDRTYFTDIDNNGQADIPYEVLIGPGILLIGACGYTQSNNIKNLILSPIPQKFEVVRGSYSSDMIPSSSPTPDDYETYKASIQTQLTTINNTLNEKVDKVSGKGLSTKDFTAAYETKLKNIENNAQVNKIEVISINNEDIPINEKKINIDLTNIEKDIDDNTSRIKRMETDLFDSGQASGTSINFKDSTMAEATEIEIDGGWNQTTTKGHNLIKKISSYRWNNNGSGTTHEYIDDYIKINLSETPDKYAGIYSIDLRTDLNGLEGEKVVYSFYAKADKNRTIFYQAAGKGAQTYINLTSKWQRFFVNIESLGSQAPTFYCGSSLDSTPFYIKDIMIEKGDELHDYEDYSGREESPNLKYSQEMKVIESGTYNTYTFGKNLLKYPFKNTTKKENGITFTDNGDGTITVDGTAINNAFFRILEESSIDKKITANYISGGNSQVRLQIIHRENDAYYTLAMNTNGSTKIDKSIYQKGYIELVVLSGTTCNNILIKPMLTMNPNIEFESYIESKLDIIIPKNNFFAKLSDIVTDKIVAKYSEEDKHYCLYLKKNVGRKFFNDVLSVVPSEDDNHNFTNIIRFGKIDDAKIGDWTPFKSNLFIDGKGIKKGAGRLGSNDNIFYAYRIDEQVETLEKAKAFIKENPLIVYYPLAKPYTLDLGIIDDMLLTFFKETNVFNDFPLEVDMTLYYLRDTKETILQLQANDKAANEKIQSLETNVATLQEQVNKLMTTTTNEEVIENVTTEG